MNGGLIAPEDLYLSSARKRPHPSTLQRAAGEVGNLLHLAEVLRGPSGYAAPEALVQGLRELLDSQRLEILRP